MKPIFEIPELLNLSGITITSDILGLLGPGAGCYDGCHDGCDSGCDTGSGSGKKISNDFPPG